MTAAHEPIEWREHLDDVMVAEFHDLSATVMQYGGAWLAGITRPDSTNYSTWHRNNLDARAWAETELRQPRQS